MVDIKYKIELYAMMIALLKGIMKQDRLATPTEYVAAYFEYLEENEFFDYCAGDALFCKHCCDWRDAI